MNIRLFKNWKLSFVPILKRLPLCHAVNYFRFQLLRQCSGIEYDRFANNKISFVRTTKIELISCVLFSFNSFLLFNIIHTLDFIMSLFIWYLPVFVTIYDGLCLFLYTSPIYFTFFVEFLMQVFFATILRECYAKLTICWKLLLCLPISRPIEVFNTIFKYICRIGRKYAGK